jgi:hypothetical protein
VTAPWREVERELSRARSARRLIPFAAASAALVAALTAWVTRSWRSGLLLLAPGALFLLFAAAASVPRCPGCGASLWQRGEGPGSAASRRPTQVERERHCRRCGARFD